MPTSTSSIQNPQGGLLWKTVPSQVRGIAVNKIGDNHHAQSGPSIHRNDQVVIIDDFDSLLQNKPSEKIPGSSHLGLKDSSHRARNACDFCRKNRIRCIGGPPCASCFSRGILCKYLLSALPTGIQSSKDTENRVNTRQQRSPSMDRDAPVPLMASQSKSKGATDLPQSILHRLENWYLKNGRQLPPCATSDGGIPQSQHKDGRNALWKHKLGEILTVSMHTLPGFESFLDPRKYILIARGSTVGPHVVHWHGSGNGKTLHYKIWLGVDGDERGFEKSSSILKSSALNEPKKKNCISIDELQNTSVSASLGFHGPKSPSTRVTDNDEFPEVLAQQLEIWYRTNERKMPPCVSTCDDESTITQIHGMTAVWKHKSGDSMTARLYQVPGFPQWRKRLIVVHGETTGPYIVLSRTARADDNHQYKIWLGVDGDSKGFEKEPSIFKCRAQRHCEATPHPKKAAEAPAGESGKISRKSLAAKDTAEPDIDPKTAVNRKRKRVVEDDSDDDEFVDGGSQSNIKYQQGSEKAPTRLKAPARPLPPIQAPKMSTPDINIARLDARLTRIEAAQAQTPQSLIWQTPKTYIEPAANAIPTAEDDTNRIEAQQPPERQTLTTSNPLIPAAKLKTHMLTNAVFFFYNSDNTVIRYKAFTFCDTVNKLFNQARVAKIFRNEGYLTLALQIRGEEKPTFIAEGDAEDFNAFVEALTESSCWGIDVEGKIKGACTIEIGEFKGR